MRARRTRAVPDHPLRQQREEGQARVEPRGSVQEPVYRAENSCWPHDDRFWKVLSYNLFASGFGLEDHNELD